MRISVITAVYNRVGTVREAIESVQAQRFDGLEHVLIDGASTDGSLEVMRELADERTVLVSEPDEGIFGLSYTISMGQWLSLPMVLTGAALLAWAWRRATMRPLSGRCCAVWPRPSITCCCASP